jgi:curved DNA-binding protein CbpA
LTAPPGAGGPSGGSPPGATVDADASEVDHYQVLGIPYTATAAEISRAYREAMKRVHPDRQQPDRRAAAEGRARAINAAYAVLKHPLRRQAYDRTIRARLVQDQMMSRYVGGFYPAAPGGVDPAGAPRRETTPAERRERAEADRTAFVTLIVAFAAFTVVLLAGLLIWGVLSSLFR